MNTLPSPISLRRFISLSVLILATPVFLCAQNTWKGRDGEWSDSKNWSKSAVPSLESPPATPAATPPTKNSTPAPGAKPSGPQPPAFPAALTPLTANAIVLSGGTVTWDASVLGDFAVEAPVLITKKAGWKQTGGPAWMFIRNGGFLTVNDGTLDGGTSENLIVGGELPGHVLVTGNDAVLTMPAGEIKLRRNANFVIRGGNVSAKLISFDDPAEDTHGVLTLAGGTLTLSTNAYGGIYGGDSHHYINFPAGSKASLILTAIENDAVYEQLEKGGIRFNHRIDTGAFKVELREGSGSVITVDPAAKP